MSGALWRIVVYCVGSMTGMFGAVEIVSVDAVFVYWLSAFCLFLGLAIAGGYCFAERITEKYGVSIVICIGCR